MSCVPFLFSPPQTIRHVQFRVNGKLVKTASGEVDWTELQFGVERGLTTLAWTYRTDAALRSGSNAVFLDQLQLPIGVPGLGVSRAEPDRPRLDVTYTPNAVVVLESSSDLRTWQLAQTITIGATGRASIATSNSSRMFYRVRLP